MRVDFSKIINFFQSNDFTNMKHTIDDVENILLPILATDFFRFSRQLVSSNKTNEEISSMLLAFSKYLMNMRNNVTCEHGYLLFTNIFDQLKFCKRYTVLLKLSEGVALNSVLHLNNIKNATITKQNRQITDSKMDDEDIENSDGKSFSKEIKMILMAISNFLKLVLGGLQHSPRGFLKCLEYLLSFLEFVDMEDSEIANIIVEILNFSKYIHRDLINEMEDVQSLLASSNVLQRYGKKKAIDLQNYAIQCSWTAVASNEESKKNNTKNDSNLLTEIINVETVNPTNVGVQAVTSDEERKVDNTGSLPPPPWPVGSYEMETLINLDLNSIRSSRASKVQALSLTEEHGKPCQFEGSLIKSDGTNEEFPFELLGNLKVYRKKDKNNYGGEAAASTDDLKYESWSCPKCTFRNEGDAKTCKTCNAPAPPRTKLAKQGENPGVMQLSFHRSGNSFYGWYGRGSDEKSWLGKRIVQADGAFSLSSCRNNVSNNSSNFNMVDFGQYYNNVDQMDDIIKDDDMRKEMILGIDTKKSFSYNSSESFSVALYFSRNLLGGKDTTGSQLQTLVSNNKYGISIDANGNLYAWYDTTSCKYAQTPIKDIKFYHVVLNWNPNNKSLQLYLNGTMLKPDSNDLPASCSTISSLIIGARYYDKRLNERFYGKICEVRVYSGEDDNYINNILSNYENKEIAFRNNSSLKGYWPLLDDGDMVSFLVDKSNNSNNASIIYNNGKPLSRKLLLSDANIFPINGHFRKREGNFLYAGVSDWNSTENRFFVGNENSNGGIWCAEKINVRNKVSLSIKNMKSMFSDNNKGTRFTIMLHDCSWWEIEPTNCYETTEGSDSEGAVKDKDTDSRMDVDRDIPTAPQANINASSSYPSDDLINQFLMLTGSATKDDAVLFLQEANMSFEQAVSLYFDPTQKNRILNDAKSRTIAPPIPEIQSASSNSNSNESDAAGKIISDKTKLPIKKMVPGIYIDVIPEKIDNVETYCISLRYSNKSGKMAVYASADNILKCENDLELIIDAKRNEIQFIQCNSNREKFRKILKVKSLDLFNNFKDAWFGLVARNVSFDDAILMCSSSKTENVITEKDFNNELLDLNKYFSKSEDEEKKEKEASSAAASSNSGNPRDGDQSNKLEPDAETKNFMELTMVTDVSLATRWVKGNNNNAQAAIIAYFNDPTKVPPAILAPVIQRQSNAIGIESKTPSDGENKENEKKKKEIGGKEGDSEEDVLLKAKALKQVLQNKYASTPPLDDKILARGDVFNDYMYDVMELWDTTNGNFLITRNRKEYLVEVLSGTTKKNTHNIYGYACLPKSVDFTKDIYNDEADAKQIKWTIKGWWSDAGSANKTKNLILIKLNFATDTLNGILFKGNSIIEWRGKRTMDYENFRNSFQNSTGCCGLVNGKDNLTNICFQNSLLQSLYRSSEFRTGVLHFNSVFNDRNAENNVVKALADLYASLSGIDKPYVASHKLQRALPSGTFGSGQQQDVSEFWQYLSSEFSQIGLEKTEYDVTGNLFGSTIRNSMQCFKCGNLKIGKEEPYLDVPLVFPTRFKAITDIKVVSGKGLEIEIPEGYERHGFNLNEGREDTPYVFLCVKRSPDENVQPLSDLTVVDCGSTDPRPDLPGWEFVDGNLNQGGLSTAKRVYLAYKRGEGSPISNIDIIVGKDTHVKEGFSKISKDVNGGEKEPIFICYLQDLPIRDIVVRDSGAKGYTFVDVNISPNDANQLYVCHTDQSQNEPITGIELIDQEVVESMQEEERRRFQILSKDYGTNGKSQYLVATRGNGCPITEIHIFRAPRIRPRHGYPEYIDLVKSNEAWPQRLNGNWLSTNTKPRTQRDRARKKVPFKIHNRVENAIRIKGTYSGYGGGELSGILVQVTANTGTYTAMCHIKGGNFKASQFINLTTLDNFNNIQVSGTLYLPSDSNSILGVVNNNNNNNNSVLFPESINVSAARSDQPLVVKSFITDVTVATSIDSVPSGFTIVDKCCNDLSSAANLNRDCVAIKHTYICVKRDPNKLPLIDIGVVWGFEMPVNYGYEVVRSDGSTNEDCNLNQGMDVPELYLCTRRATEVNDKTKGLMDIAILRVGGVSSAKAPESFEKVEKSQGTMRHDADLNTGNVHKHRLYLCKKLDKAAEMPIEHCANANYQSNQFGMISLYGISKSYAHSVLGSFDPKIDPNARMRGEAEQYQGTIRGVMIPRGAQENNDKLDWEFLGQWKDSSTQHHMACALTFKHPYAECQGEYSDGKEEYKWSFVKDDFIQMSFKKDYNCSFKNSEMEFGERCFRHDISNMVLNFFSPSVNPEIDCDTCQLRTAHTNRVHCTKSPEHLMLTVKRMSFDWRSNKNIKSLMNAHFSSTVTLPRYDDPARSPDDSNDTTSAIDTKCRSYGLFAVIVHSGKTANSGHYYAYARSANAIDLHKQDSPEAPWIKFNDMRVNYVEGGFKGMRETISKAVGANAYILVYKRLKDSKLAIHKSALPGEMVPGLQPIGSDQRISDGGSNDDNDEEEDEEAKLLSLALQISKNDDANVEANVVEYGGDVTVVENDTSGGGMEISDDEALQMALALSKSSVAVVEDGENKETDHATQGGVIESKLEDNNAAAVISTSTITVEQEKSLEISGKDFTQSLPHWYSNIEKDNAEAIEDISKMDTSWIELIRSVTDATGNNESVVEVGATKNSLN